MIEAAMDDWLYDVKVVYISLGNNTPSIQLSERHLEDTGGWAVSDSANIANDYREESTCCLKSL